MEIAFGLSCLRLNLDLGALCVNTNQKFGKAIYCVRAREFSCT